MNANLIVGGIITIFMGLVSLYLMGNYVNNCQISANNPNSMIGFDSQLCQAFSYLRLGFMAMFFIGFGVIIYGIFAKKPTTKKKGKSFPWDQLFTP